MGFKPASSLTEQIADHIGAEIIQGTRAPLERIQELHVAKDLGVSRGSVREALLILEARHLVEIYPRRGAVVTDLEPHQIDNYLTLSTELLVMLYRKLADVCRTRDVSFGGIDAALEAMQSAQRDEDVLAFIESRSMLVHAVFPLVEDRYLESVLVSLLPAAQRLAFLATRNSEYDMQDTVRNARALIDAVKAADDERICQLIRAYIEREARLAGATVRAAKERRASG